MPLNHTHTLTQTHAQMVSTTFHSSSISLSLSLSFFSNSSHNLSGLYAFKEEGRKGRTEGPCSSNRQAYKNFTLMYKRVRYSLNFRLEFGRVVLQRCNILPRKCFFHICPLFRAICLGKERTDEANVHQNQVDCKVYLTSFLSSTYPI